MNIQNDDKITKYVPYKINRNYHSKKIKVWIIENTKFILNNLSINIHNHLNKLRLFFLA